jgi:hypothetical protein
MRTSGERLELAAAIRSLLLDSLPVERVELAVDTDGESPLYNVRLVNPTRSRLEYDWLIEMGAAHVLGLSAFRHIAFRICVVRDGERMSP